MTQSHRSLQAHARTAFAVICALLLIAPLFFISQIILGALGLPEISPFGAEGRNILAHTPVFSLVAPFLRAPLIGLVLILLLRRSNWTAVVFMIATLIHLVSWIIILGNAYFTLPTGYLTLALEAAGIYLLFRYPRLRGPRAEAAARASAVSVSDR